MALIVYFLIAALLVAAQVTLFVLMVLRMDARLGYDSMIFGAAYLFIWRGRGIDCTLRVVDRMFVCRTGNPGDQETG